DLVGVTQQGDVRDAATEEDLRGTQDALVVALWKNDVPTVLARPVDQPVLEHQGCDDVGGGDVEAVQQRVAVDVPFEQGTCGVDGPVGGLGQASADAGQGRGCLVGAQVSGDEREPGCHAIQQPFDRRRQGEASVEHDGRQ